MEKKETRKESNRLRTAIVISVIALLLCMFAFVGTTYAWFTDTASSNGNVIKSGTLKVGFTWAEGNEEPTDATWNDATTVAIFDNDKWEPGVVEAKHIKVKNTGTLAFKYKLEIKPTGEVSALADVIDVYMQSPSVKVERTTVTDMKKLGTLTDLIAGDIATGTLTATEEYDFTLALKMDGSLGNDYQDLSIGTSFAVKLIATQVSLEEDGFGADYDSEATLDFASVASEQELINAINEGETNLLLSSNIELTSSLEVTAGTTINGNGKKITRAENFSGSLMKVNPAPATYGLRQTVNNTLTLENIVLDGGAVWSGEVDETLNRGVENSGIASSRYLLETVGNANVVLGEGAILQNNSVAAVSLATRGGGSLTMNGAQIINNNSNGGSAIWGGGNIIINEGSLISGNYSTGIGGAVRMVSNCNFTMNGGKIANNKAATDGGVIWGYGSSTYNLNGGEIAYNEAGGVGGFLYTGTYSVVNIGGTFELHDNKATEIGAIRLTDHTSMTVTGGKIYGNSQTNKEYEIDTWNNNVKLDGGEFSDDLSYIGGLSLTIGKADIDGVIYYGLATNHNTAYLSTEFNSFSFKVDETNANFANFNFKPAEGYEYVDGDENKLVCLNEGYTTYWDAEKAVFKLKANEATAE